MPLNRRSLMEAAAARFGCRRAYSDTTQVNALLTVQPSVLDVRGRVLADVLKGRMDLEAQYADAVA
ncbi:hypothetical protein ACH4C6_32485 [Streptomyces sp. NPDC017943]|uniref:hypothetical protein n=1 Tax=Streptomyces sp. NPDC017943 TaxID=3365019 RepID=UPI0037B9D726